MNKSCFKFRCVSICFSLILFVSFIVCSVSFCFKNCSVLEQNLSDFTFAESNLKTKKLASKDTKKDYYIVYDFNDNEKVVFVRGDEMIDGDEYISADNKKYVICETDKKTKTAKAKFVEDIKLPVLNLKRNDSKFASNNSSSKQKLTNSVAFASEGKKVGIYHTHNDECYNDEDGVDSIYGKGGIHDIGKQLMGNLENLGIAVEYSENLHLPHNSGAYLRSETTASQILDSGNIDALFDVHRDATPRKEYLTTVNGETMSKVRMVLGSANQNSAANKEFALSIKAYADEVYPGLIKDIYIGKGNYNQQLFHRAILFEMGTNLIEKEFVRRSTLPLAKTIDGVLYGMKNASSKTKEDVVEVSATSSKNMSFTDEGLVASKTSTSSGNVLFVVLMVIGGILVVLGILIAFVPKVRHKVCRFFSQIFPFKKRD